MKKIISTIAALAMTVVVSGAASFTWGTGTVSVTFGGERVTDGMGYLVYLGTSENFYDITDYVVNNPVVSEKNTTATGLPVAFGRIVGNFTCLMADTMPNTSDTLSNGDVFGMIIKWTDADGTEWINVASNTYTVEGLVNDGSNLTAAVFDFNFDQSSDGTLTSGGGWVAVPEPATATLALAGVAMLFRRRK